MVPLMAQGLSNAVIGKTASSSARARGQQVHDPDLREARPRTLLGHPPPCPGRPGLSRRQTRLRIASATARSAAASRRARRLRGRCRRRGRRASRAGRTTLPGVSVRPRGWPRTRRGNGTSGSSLPSRSSSSVRETTMARAARSSPPTGKPFRYQATCLRKSRDASLFPPPTTRPAARRGGAYGGDLAEGAAGPAPAGRRRRRRGRRRATAGPGSRGRRRRRRSRSRRIIRRASSASQMSPLPSTGMSRRLLERGDRVPVGRARVALGGGAGVQRDPRDAGVLRRSARPRAYVRWSSSMPLRILMVTGSRPARRVDRGAHDWPNRRRFHGSAEPPPRAGDLRDRAAEVHVDVVGEVLVDDHPRRPCG